MEVDGVGAWVHPHRCADNEDIVSLGLLHIYADLGGVSSSTFRGGNTADFLSTAVVTERVYHEWPIGRYFCLAVAGAVCGCAGDFKSIAHVQMVYRLKGSVL